MRTLIKNATLVLPDRLLERGWLLIEADKIVGLGESNTCPTQEGPQLDAKGDFLLPGLIDLHCDAIEKLVEPRPGVQFDLHVALHEVDRRLAGCGITTEFHALSLDDNEFGVRSVNFVHDFAQAIKSEHDNLVRHEVHARLELTSQIGFETVSRLIAGKEVRLASLMNHTPGQGQYTTEELFRTYIKRTIHRSDAEIDALLAMKKSQEAEIPRRIESITQQARAAGIALATHDDDTAEKVEQWPALGITIVEFPTTMEAARRASELGLAVCMGAPNVLRGKSSGGNLSAIQAIQAGVCDVLCSDYYPSAMLTATFKLASHQLMSLPQAVQMVSLRPAQAVGLGAELGSLEIGKVADLIVVRLERHPKVRRVFVSGRERLVHS
ncbi:MAG: alpha-D-ribose 1-methylphosphonate 5-triphosphate diphosphatase [Chloroflexota bacterium]|nr:alpha-D-ribose 1-methylphosphonate 5-triphosphate diphosphatase [Chloroflexota bacterium]